MGWAHDPVTNTSIPCPVIGTTWLSPNGPHVQNSYAIEGPTVYSFTRVIEVRIHFKGANPPSGIYVRLTSTAQLTASATWVGFEIPTPITVHTFSNGLGSSYVHNESSMPDMRASLIAEESKTVRIPLDSQGNGVLSMNLEASADVYSPSTDTFAKLDVVLASTTPQPAFGMKRLHFPAGVNLDPWNTNFAGSSGTSSDPWISSNGTQGVAGAFIYPKGVNMGVDATYSFTYPNLPFDLLGTLTGNSFAKAVTAPSGGEDTVSIASANILQSKIYSFDWNILWNASINTPYTSPSPIYTGTGKVFVSWGLPLNGETPTLKRVGWSWQAADQADSEEHVADGIWQKLSAGPFPLVPPWSVPGNPPIAPLGQEWAMLDGTYSGECDEQGRLMRRSLNLLGVSATDGLVHGSTDADVTTLEHKTINGRVAFLLMNFHPTG